MFSDYLSLVKFKSVRKALRKAEESVVGEIRSADVLSLIAGYRLTCRWALYRKVLVAHRDLPERLQRRLSPVKHAMLRDRIETVVAELAERQEQVDIPALEPVADVRFAYDDDAERARRLPIYVRQFESVLAEFGTTVDGSPKGHGPAAAPVRGTCQKTGRRVTFPSARQAAKWLNQIAGLRAMLEALTDENHRLETWLRENPKAYRTFSGLDVRLAIRRQQPCGGMTWERVGKAKVLGSGLNRAVWCQTLKKKFTSLRAAAEYVSVPAGQLASRLAKSGERGCEFGMHHMVLVAYRPRKRRMRPDCPGQLEMTWDEPVVFVESWADATAYEREMERAA